MSKKQRAGDPACPCESGRLYAECCALCHQGTPAPTAQALMRSRYSAYALRLSLYLLATWHPSTRPPPDEVELGDGPTTWLGLNILRADENGDEAVVEFVARYRIGGASAVRLHETSRFVRERGVWYYVDGVIKP
jgi:SEC-C motif-containing protein